MYSLELDWMHQSEATKVEGVLVLSIEHKLYFAPTTGIDNSLQTDLKLRLVTNAYKFVST
ncbi:MAG: hypothetical protein L3J59_09975 [Methylococcaceae bacterium]|nr:hypothetical protein [Methylococcaceae bacterium]